MMRAAGVSSFIVVTERAKSVVLPRSAASASQRPYQLASLLRLMGQLDTGADSPKWGNHDTNACIVFAMTCTEMHVPGSSQSCLAPAPRDRLFLLTEL